MLIQMCENLFFIFKLKTNSKRRKLIHHTLKAFVVNTCSLSLSFIRTSKTADSFAGVNK